MVLKECINKDNKNKNGLINNYKNSKIYGNGEILEQENLMKVKTIY